MVWIVSLHLRYPGNALDDSKLDLVLFLAETVVGLFQGLFQEETSSQGGSKSDLQTFKQEHEEVQLFEKESLCPL